MLDLMFDFDLPATTKVQRVIPKNSFDSFATPKQKRLFTELVLRITWTHKISTNTTNLRSENLQEIQFFTVELKKKAPVKELVDLIDRSIPYAIVFRVIFAEEHYFHTSMKRINAQDEDKAIIDFTFADDWSAESSIKPKLKASIDDCYRNLCLQLSDFSDDTELSLNALVEKQRTTNTLKKEISTLKSSIKKSKSFKEKVDLNQKLKNAERQLTTT